MEFAPLSKDLNSLSDLRSREIKAILTVREKSLEMDITLQRIQQHCHIRATKG